VVRRWITRELSPAVRIQAFASQAQDAVRAILRLAEAPAATSPPVEEPSAPWGWFAAGAAVAAAAFVLARLLG
jgi:ubiquinone biosynthesis protein